MPAHFYHLWLGGDWLPLADEYFEALRAAEYDGEVRVCVVGLPDQRRNAKRWLAGRAVVDREADTGYGHVTLEAIRDYARAAAPDTAIGFAHAKGLWHTGSSQDAWRRCMLRHTVTGWRHCVELLADYDTVGAHWLPNLGLGGIYGGDFWWASAAYLSGLPPVNRADRSWTEAWIGLDHPKAANLDNRSINHPHSYA